MEFPLITTGMVTLDLDASERTASIFTLPESLPTICLALETVSVGRTVGFLLHKHRNKHTPAKQAPIFIILTDFSFLVKIFRYCMLLKEIGRPSFDWLRNPKAAR